MHPITGCAIHTDHARLDFDLEQNTLDKIELTARINEIIQKDVPIEILNWPIQARKKIIRPLVRTAFDELTA